MTSILPLPTDIQYQNFAEHICDAHSWYKHIPLFDGAEFIFFLSENAGGNYSPEHPRLHHTWKTSDEYRHKFGYLDYMYRFGDDTDFSRDSVQIFCESLPVVGAIATSVDNIRPPSLDPRSAILYPYVACYYFGKEVLFDIIKEEHLDRLNLRGSHPDRDKILAWVDAYSLYDRQWHSLSERARELVLKLGEIEMATLDKYDLPSEVANYLRQQETAERLYDRLQAQERAKIDRALADLQRLAIRGNPVWY